MKLIFRLTESSVYSLASATHAFKIQSDVSWFFYCCFFFLFYFILFFFCERKKRLVKTLDKVGPIIELR